MQKNPAAVSSRLAQLFPESVVVADLSSAASADLLYDEELAATSAFSEKRIADFVAGRLCARRALEQLGLERFPLAIQSDRTPAWPRDIVGSISHTAGYCVAAVARREDIRALGIDAEGVDRVTDDLWPQLFTGAESVAFRALQTDRKTLQSNAAFAAKEAFYKCQFTVTKEWVDFTDVEIVFSKDDSSFVVRAVDRAGPAIAAAVSGAYRLIEGTIIAGVWLRV